MIHKPHLQIPIVECGEPLVAIPPNPFAQPDAHPYLTLGAPYGEKSPYFLRLGVLDALYGAQGDLSQRCPGWRIQIVDAYRPIAVQQFMVEHTFTEVVRSRGLDAHSLTPEEVNAVLETVYEFWAAPSADPKTPPPHSTGAAVDVTLVDTTGHPVDMGSAIDEISPRSYPTYYDEAPPDSLHRNGVDGDRLQEYRQNRLLLYQVMTTAGFRQHPREWWHFSRGDQLWAWLTQGDRPDQPVVARYGAI